MRESQSRGTNTGFGHPAESGGWRLTDVNEGRVTRKYESLPPRIELPFFSALKGSLKMLHRRFKKTAACNACFRLLCIGQQPGCCKL